MFYRYVITALMLVSAVSLGVSATAQAKSVKTENTPESLQKGTLANQKLQQDAMTGVAMKAGTMGCGNITDVQPFVTRMPSGKTGARKWQEMWVVQCGKPKYNIVINFKENGNVGVYWDIQ